MKYLVQSALIASLAIAILDARAWAQSPTPVNTCGQVLDQPGEYVLTGALDQSECPSYSCGSGGAITITASNVHLDTAGHGINAICAAVVIADGVTNVRIDGGGWLVGGSGVIIGNDSGIEVSGLADIHGDPDLGSTETGIEIDGADHVTVSHNIIEGVYGIHGQTNDSQFLGNKLYGLGIVNYGIVITGQDNIIRNNGIRLSGLSVQNIGISVTDHNHIRRNRIHQATVGVSLAGNSNRVVQNVVHGAVPPNAPVASIYGIYAGQGASGNVIKRNRTSGDAYDVYDQNGPPRVNNWHRNHFQTMGGAVACIH